MSEEFIIQKKSRTYAETLEAFGVAILLNDVLEHLGVGGRKITIEDKGLYYSVVSNKEISVEMLENLSFFQVVKFLINKPNTEVPKGIPRNQCFDYPAQKAEQDRYKEELKKIENNTNLTAEAKKTARNLLKTQKNNEFGLSIDKEYDVYRELIKNPYTSYTNLYDNFYNSQEHFSLLLKEIIAYYTHSQLPKRDFKIKDENPTAQQLFNPNQGKGLNKSKANNASMGNLNSNWISETMKISGALHMMSAQYVKVGSTYDLKLYVPEFKEIQLNKALELMLEFKRYLKSASPVKLDILNILDLTKRFIIQTPEYQKGKVKNTIKGFYTVYQKDLGQNKAVANIAYNNIPDFVAYENQIQGKEWISILESQRSIICGIEEMGNSIQGLQNYRNFLNSNGEMALAYFHSFIKWYAVYLMQSITDEKYYVKPFEIETLNKFYNNMNTQELNLKEIIENEGFQAVAKAIRKSTVTLQYTPKESRKFEIRYGLAQQLQNKSKSKEDLATFIGDFVGTYNSSIAYKIDKILKEGKSLDEANKIISRANVKDEELVQFYTLLDERPSRLIGALLASYGFALNKKEAPKDEELEDNQIETEA